MSGWTQEWNEEQRAFIDKLGKMENAFNDIFARDRDGLVIGYDERKELENLRKKNLKILNKLVKQEFTVAVVGLEKAGKSTLGNALIKKNMLPEYTERCTYTTTEIRADKENFAEVYFYKPTEFRENFQKMLNAVKFDGAADFLSLDRRTFDKFWNAMEDNDPNTYQVHNGTTVEDIRAILDGKETISRLLGQPPRRFTDAETDEMQIYITGIDGRSAEGYVKRTVHPYAVENVIIKSTELQDMDHVVLYDVPGFDSPTQLHKDQTEAMLKEADAIVLVTNAGDRPNLTGTQLDMLRKGRDEDDVPLSAKAFVFGNKIDIAMNKQVASDNEAALRNDAVNKYRIAANDKVMVGSAKAYLDKNGISSSDERSAGTTPSQDKLNEWGMTDGIENLKNRMRDYYNGERYEVLRKRADKTLERTEKYFDELLEKYSPEKIRELDDAGTQYVVDAMYEIKKFVRDANVMLQQHITQIEDERPFSRLIEDNIEQIFPFVDENSEQLYDVIHSGKVVSHGNFPATRVDADLREVLKTKFTENLVERVSERTRKEQQDFRRELVETFLNNLGMKENSVNKDSLIEKTNKLFDRLIVEGGEECRFNSLVERFTSSLIEGVIRRPFGVKERYDHVTGDWEINEFISLAVYYKQGEKSGTIDDLNKKQRRIFAQILAHEGVTAPDTDNALDDSGNRDALVKFFSDNRDLINKGAEIASDMLPLDKWAKMILKAGIKLNGNTESFSKWNDRLRNQSAQKEWVHFNVNEKINKFDNLVKKFCENNKKTSSQFDTKNRYGAKIDLPKDDAPFSEFLEAFNKMGYSRRSELDANKESMLQTLNTDIVILRDLTLHSVIWAIGLERAYNSVIEKNVELIRNGVTDNQQIMRDWLEKNIKEIKESEFAAIINEQAQNQTRRMIVDSIKNVLNGVNI